MIKENFFLSFLSTEPNQTNTVESPLGSFFLSIFTINLFLEFPSSSHPFVAFPEFPPTFLAFHLNFFLLSTSTRFLFFFLFFSLLVNFTRLDRRMTFHRKKLKQKKNFSIVLYPDALQLTEEKKKKCEIGSIRSFSRPKRRRLKLGLNVVRSTLEKFFVSPALLWLCKCSRRESEGKMRAESDRGEPSKGAH